MVLFYNFVILVSLFIIKGSLARYAPGPIDCPTEDIVRPADV